MPSIYAHHLSLKFHYRKSKEKLFFTSHTLGVCVINLQPQLSELNLDITSNLPHNNANYGQRGDRNMLAVSKFSSSFCPHSGHAAKRSKVINYVHSANAFNPLMGLIQLNRKSFHM